jgi:Flp pilus assembly CpaF family ATPase
MQPYIAGQFWVNEPGRVFVARRGRSELTTTILGAGELADLVERMLRTSGRRIDMSTPFVDATMADGSRLHVVIPVSTRTADTSARTQGRRRTVCEPGNNGYSSHLYHYST